MFRARVFGPLCLTLVLTVAYAPSASALAVFEAFGFAAISVEGEVMVTFEDPEPNGPILFAPLSLGPTETTSDTAESFVLGAPVDPGFENFDFDALLPDDVAASAFAWVLGAAQGPAAMVGEMATAMGEVFLINPNDVEVDVSLTVYRVAGAYADVDDLATETAASDGAASIFGDDLAVAEAGLVSLQTSDTTTVFALQIAPGGFAAIELSAEATGEAFSNQVTPEPSTALLLGLGLLGLGTRQRSRV